MTADELIQHYPRLYHMAEAGTWEAMRDHGLRSTSALLDLFEIGGAERFGIESCHRPDSVTIHSERHGSAVIRDQKPMSDSSLRRCLQGMSPREWYELLNGKAFFWVSEKRLDTLLNARAYRNREHCVLTVDTALLVSRHIERICLSPMNSGCTKPFPHPRGRKTFLPVSDYPFEERRRAGKDGVVELTVEYSVPDIADLVRRVERVRTGQSAVVIWEPVSRY